MSLVRAAREPAATRACCGRTSLLWSRELGTVARARRMSLSWPCEVPASPSRPRKAPASLLRPRKAPASPLRPARGLREPAAAVRGPHKAVVTARGRCDRARPLQPRERPPWPHGFARPPVLLILVPSGGRNGKFCPYRPTQVEI